MKYKAIVDKQFEFPELSSSGLDLRPDGEGKFHILVGNRSYQAEVRSADWVNRELEIRLNGRNFTVRIEDEYDQLIDQLGLKKTGGQQVKNIYAPMPGLVLKTEVSVGQEVAAGDLLIVLEAMKMENVIKANAAGRVKTLHMQAGDAVDKGQLLIEME